MQTVVITGGSSGIGLGIAKEYVKKGANIVLLARNLQRLESAVSECKSIVENNNQSILSFSIDVTNKEQLDACVDDITSQLGAPDLLILSAGIIASERFIDISDQRFNNIIETNVMGSRLVVRAFSTAMIRKKTGHICFISSLAGVIPAYGYSAYSASKFALVGMAGVIRQEFAEYNIGVSVVCPPEVDTPMVVNEAEHILPQTRFTKDLGGTLSVEEVTRCIIKGVTKNRFMIIPGLRAKISYWHSRVFPNTFRAIMQMLVRFSNK